MPLTEPDNFPKNEGLNKKDVDNKNFLGKIVDIPQSFSKKIIKNYLWIELFTLIMIIFLGTGEILNRDISSGWYVILGMFISIIILKYFRKEIKDKTNNE